MSLREQYARDLRILRAGGEGFCTFDLEKVPAAERPDHYEAISAEIEKPPGDLRVYREGSPLIYIVRRAAPERRIR